MSKRRSGFGDLELDSPEGQKRKKDDETARRFKEKHSLDSDEEDEQKEEFMNEEDIEGQEEGTVDYEEGIKITPFNMQEELEEGHFDKDGTYIFDKNKDQIRDEWMDNIDWVKIKAQEKKQCQEENDSDTDDEPDRPDTQTVYREMLEFVRPGETITKALRRLGSSKGKQMSSSDRWKAKKKGLSTVADEQTVKSKEDFLKLTGLADQLLQNGDMNIYEMTYEKLSYELKQMEATKSVRTTVPEDADDALDMFAEDIDNTAETKTTEEKGVASSSSSSSALASGEVMWEYKWENTDQEEIHGPHSSSEMLKWTEDGYFSKGVFVRKLGTDSQFYSSKRIDFDLFT